MVERLVIRSFAGLYVTLDIGDITVFIGPQASGKSVCAKCLYWFKSFFSELSYSLNAGQDKRAFDASRLNSFKDYFPNLWQSEGSFELRYQVGGVHIELIQANGKLRLVYSPTIQSAAAEMRSQLRRIQAKYEVNASSRPARNTILIHQNTIERSSVHSEWVTKIHTLTDNTFSNNQAFVLAGRSIFSALQGTLLTFLSTNSLNDPFLKDFLREYEHARQDQPQPTEPLLKTVAPLVESILKGRLTAQKGEDFLVLPNGKHLSLTYASSGQQEAYPLILFLLSYLNDYRREFAGPQVLYIEEPEAHLYPDSQWAIVRLMASVFNASLIDSNSQLVITTHSPYLLSTFNNLIRAHQLAELFKDSPEQLNALYRIVPKNQQLALENFRVYALADGKARSIISAEDGLIVADKLDEVSERISQQFDKLLHLEAQAAADEKAS